MSYLANVVGAHTRLREDLLNYRKASQSERQQILQHWKQQVAALEINQTPESVVSAYITMVNASQMINYADIIDRMENQGYFGIMADFFPLKGLIENSSEKIVKLERDDVRKTNSGQYAPLKEYFEIKIPNMRLKVSPSQIPDEIWSLFREAQQEILNQTGKANLYDLNQLDISYVASNQLFPIRIQGMGALENHAVDRTSATAEGKYRFAYGFGQFTSPGGGMILIADLPQLNQNGQTKLRQMLNEHLEEEHGNLWLKATQEYNKINPRDFLHVLHLLIDKLRFEDFKQEMLELCSLNFEVSNAELLKILIAKVDERLQQNQNEEAKDLHTLRASLQVETFALTDMYQEAIQYISNNHIEVEIEQFLDTRALGGRQFAHTFLFTGCSLETWFAQKFPGFDTEFADDLVNSRGKYLTLLELLARSRDIKFSHIVIPLAHSAAILDVNPAQLYWNENQFQLARFMLTAPNEAVQIFRTIIQKLDNLPDTLQYKDTKSMIISLLEQLAHPNIHQSIETDRLHTILQETRQFLDNHCESDELYWNSIFSLSENTPLYDVLMQSNHQYSLV